MSTSPIFPLFLSGKKRFHFRILPRTRTLSFRQEYYEKTGLVFKLEGIIFFLCTTQRQDEKTEWVFFSHTTVLGKDRESIFHCTNILWKDRESIFPYTIILWKDRKSIFTYTIIPWKDRKSIFSFTIILCKDRLSIIYSLEHNENYE